jgi:hypothetical protein
MISDPQFFLPPPSDLSSHVFAELLLFLHRKAVVTQVQVAIERLRVFLDRVLDGAAGLG